MGHAEDLSSMFCSELVAATYRFVSRHESVIAYITWILTLCSSFIFRVMGLLPAETLVSEYAPKNFAKEKFPLLNDASLGRVVIFKRKG